VEAAGVAQGETQSAIATLLGPTCIDCSGRWKPGRRPPTRTS
jgi:hypothetical protein